MISAVGAAASACWVKDAMQPQVGRGVTVDRVPITGLPPSAANVSYLQHGLFGPFDACEFDIPLEEFLQWAKVQSWALTPIVDPEPGSAREPGEPIRRYGSGTKEAGDPEEIVLFNGYRFSTKPSRGGAYLLVLYDPRAGRAYYYRSYR